MKDYKLLIMVIISLFEFNAIAHQNATQEIQQISNEQPEKEYRPNPAILEGVGQIVNGALSIAQNPHSRPNLGLSIANMIHGIIRIIIEKIAHKKNVEIAQLLDEDFNGICEEITREITEIIVTKKYKETLGEI